ncbi:MAG: hypothetical protein ACLUGI_11420 [Subdoligranulum sp.]
MILAIMIASCCPLCQSKVTRADGKEGNRNGSNGDRCPCFAAEQTKEKEKTSPYMAVFSTVVIIVLLAIIAPASSRCIGSSPARSAAKDAGVHRRHLARVVPSSGSAPTTPSFSAARRPPCGSSRACSAATSAPMAVMSSGGQATQVPAAIRWLVNTAFMAVASMMLTCATSAHGGHYAPASAFIGHLAVLRSALIVCAMAPAPSKVVLEVPLVREHGRRPGRTNTPWAVIFPPSVGWPFGVFLMKQFSEGIPGEMLEAARIDGASELTHRYPHCACHHQPASGDGVSYHLCQLLE